MEVRVGQKMKSELRGAPCLTSASLLQMRIKIHIHTQGMYLLSGHTYAYIPYVSGSTSNFPHFLKKLQFTGLFSSRMMGTIQSSPQPAKYFQHFPHTEKRMKRYSLIKKKSCLWLPFSIFLFCPPKIKLFLNCAHVSNITPLLTSSELCNSSAAPGTDWSWTSDRQTDRRLSAALPA